MSEHMRSAQCFKSHVNRKQSLQSFPTIVSVDRTRRDGLYIYRRITVCMERQTIDNFQDVKYNYI